MTPRWKELNNNTPKLDELKTLMINTSTCIKKILEELWVSSPHQELKRTA